MSGFAALMALSASQTRESQSSVQSALIQRQQREELKRKQQEEEERKERERQHALRLKHFEEEKKREEMQRRREQEQAATERERQRREQEERDALRYGKKGKSDGSLKWPSASSQNRTDVRRRKQPDSDGDAPMGVVLTREEKRKRKEEAELRRSLNFGKRSSQPSIHKPRRELPGGAIDVTMAPKVETGSSGSRAQSIKARIAAIPNTLVKLNVVKRDTRTIDEILQDRAKAREAKILNGDEAREFNDWFGSSKKKEPLKKPPIPLSTSAPSSGANTPSGSQSSTTKAIGISPSPSPFTTAASSKKISTCKAAASSGSIKSSSTSKPSSAQRGLGTDVRAKHSSTPSGAKVATHILKPTTSTMRTVPKVSSGARLGIPSHKRSHSLSLSDSDPPSPRPSKKRIIPQESSRNAVSDEIWKLFGKNRDAYVRKDVFSDDEDMEADASVLEREEYESARVAKREDEAALEEERHHEQEKRRRRKEKEARERRGLL